MVSGWLRPSLAMLCLAVAIGLSAPRPVFAAHTEKRGVTYAERDDEALKCDLFIPDGEGPFPGVLVVHGGAWTTGNKSKMSALGGMLADQGYTACAINYRLAPKHPFPAQIEDCKTAVRWMRTNAARFKIDPDRIGGYGYSAGGHLVALLGMTDAEAGLEGSDATADSPSTRIQCVVAGGAPCEFRILPAQNARLAYWLGGTRAEKPKAYELASPLAFVTKDDPPCFFFHGETDRLVPLMSPQAMVARLSTLGIANELHTVHGAGHLEAFLNEGATKAAIAFLDKHLKAPAKAQDTAETAK